MQALIIDKQATRLDHSLISLMDAGVYVTGTASVAVADMCISRMAIDLLVIEKGAVGDSLGDLLGAAQDRNPQLVSILRTDDVSSDHDELSPHFSSLHCVLGQDVSNTIAVQLGLASLRTQRNTPIVAKPVDRIETDTPVVSKLSPLVTRTAKPLPLYATAM